MKQYLEYWCSPGFPGDPSNDPPEQQKELLTLLLIKKVKVSVYISRGTYVTTWHKIRTRKCI